MSESTPVSGNTSITSLGTHIAATNTSNDQQKVELLPDQNLPRQVQPLSPSVCLPLSVCLSVCLFSIAFVVVVCLFFARGLDEKKYCTYSITLVNKNTHVRSL